MRKGGWKPVKVRETEQKGERDECVSGGEGGGRLAMGGGGVWVQTKDTVPFTNPEQPPRLHGRCVFSQTEQHTVERHCQIGFPAKFLSSQVNKRAGCFK